MTAPTSTAVIRQWARDRGLPVGDRGRLSPQLLNAYASSNPGEPHARKAENVATTAPASRRQTERSLRIPVQPKPGATGIRHRISARIN